jgi:hypothetical protein
MILKQISGAVAGGAEAKERGEGGFLRKGDGVADVGMKARWTEDRCDGCCRFDGVSRNKKVVSPVMLQQKDGWHGFSLIDVVGDVDNRLVFDGVFAKSEPVGFLCRCSFMEYE